MFLFGVCGLCVWCVCGFSVHSKETVWAWVGQASEVFQAETCRGGPGETTISVPNTLAGLEVKSHRSETLESSLSTEWTELGFIEGPDGTVRLRGPYDSETDTAFMAAMCQLQDDKRSRRRQCADSGEARTGSPRASQQ